LHPDEIRSRSGANKDSFMTGEAIHKKTIIKEPVKDKSRLMSLSIAKFDFPSHEIPVVHAMRSAEREWISLDCR
jgi:hypothetical protein